MMRTMYSFVSSSEVSEPEAISAWSWATVASLCRVGTLPDALCPVASFAAATGSASNAARRRDRMAGAIILFLLGRLGHAMPHTRMGGSTTSGFFWSAPHLVCAADHRLRPEILL